MAFIMFLVLLVSFVVDFLPTIIAALRSTATTGQVFLINLLLGWSLIGWIVALVMACASDGTVAQLPWPGPPGSVPDPGWYPDPIRAGYERYWDGLQWNMHPQGIRPAVWQPIAAAQPGQPSAF